jgi:hypothetical protein
MTSTGHRVTRPVSTDIEVPAPARLRGGAARRRIARAGPHVLHLP